MESYKQIKRNCGNVTPRELIDLLLSYGFEYRNTKGDHETYKKPGYRPFPIPVKKNPLPEYIVKNALRAIEEIIEKNID